MILEKERIMIKVNYYTEYNGLIIYKCDEYKRFYCHYWNSQQLHSATKYNFDKFEASCNLKSNVSLELIKPYYRIQKDNQIKECFHTLNEAKKRLLDYNCYEWFNKLSIVEVKEIINCNQSINY